jgi:hypothetical protein
MQVVPIKHTLKAPGTKRLKLQYDEPPSNFAFKLKLHRYTSAFDALRGAITGGQGLTLVHFSAQPESF